MKGDRLGPYRVLGELGSGSTAKVYLGEVVGEARGLDPGRRVALKILHAQFEAAPHVLRHFRQEIRVGRALRHENVVRLLDAGTVRVGDRTRHYLAMEHVQGRTLRELIAEEGAQAEGLCRHVGTEVANGLTAIHGTGAVHRDIKPENIVLTQDEHVKIMDLGVAHLRDESVRVSPSGDFIGSVLYAAPEQFRGPSRGLDGRADLYALGLTLYELATGVHPFQRDTIEEVMQLQLSEMPRAPSTHEPRLSPFFEYVLLRLLRKAPAQRFRTAEELSRTLQLAEESSWWRERAQVIRRFTRVRPQRPRVARQTAVYGREGELERLHGAWDDVTQGRGRVLVLTGEAGIGKSRLVDEFATRLAATDEEPHLLYGAWPTVGPGTAAGALCSAYREHFDADDLAEALAPFLTESPVLVPPFAAFLRGESPPAGAEPLDRDALNGAFLQVTRALSLEKPTLLVLEDLQHATPEGREVVGTLVQGIAEHRVLLVLTVRPGTLESWPVELTGSDHVLRLPLHRLGEESVRELLVERVGSALLAKRLAPRLTALSDGNPLFLLEIVTGLEQEGVLARDEGTGTWLLRGTLRSVQAPPRMRDLVQARLVGLGHEDREVLDAAAIIGFEFDPGLLAEVVDQPQLRLLQRLGRLERTHHLIRTRGRLCVFDHHVLQEILYDDLPPALRRAYHGAVGAALQRRLGEEGASGAEAVDACHHFLLADRGEAALDWLDPALDHLVDSHLSARAVELIDRVLAVPELVDRTSRVRLLLRQAERLCLLGRTADEARALQDALCMVSPKHDPLLAATAFTRLGDHLQQTGHAERAREFLDRAVTLARRAGSRKAIAEATCRLGAVLDALGRHDDACEVLGSCIENAHRIGDHRAESRARKNLAQTLLHLGETAGALEELQVSVVLCEVSGDLHEQGHAAAALGAALVALGRFDEAQPHLERGLDISRTVGDRAGMAAALGDLGMLSQGRGDLADAEARFAQDLGIVRECGSPAELGLSLSRVGALELLLGRPARARPPLEESRERLREVGHLVGEAWALRHLACVAAEEGALEAANGHFRTALGLCQRSGAVRDAHVIRVSWALCLYWSGEPEAAAEALGGGGQDWRLRGGSDLVLLRRALEMALDRDDNEGVVRTAFRQAATPIARYEAHALLYFSRSWIEDLESSWRLIQGLRDRAPADAWNGFLQGSRLRRLVSEAWKTVHALERRGQ